MKVLVTGGAGFIGSHVCDLLLEKGHEVVAYDNLSLGRKEFLSSCLKHDQFTFVEKDLRNLNDVVEAMSGVDLVWHLAANSDISKGAETTSIDLENGTLATYNVLEAMRIKEVKELIFASTSAVYGEADVKPTPESYGPILPISLYGASKLACEGLCSAFSHNFDIKVWIHRFANIIGPRATHGVIFDFVEKLKKTPNELQVLSNGHQKKSYLDVKDCIDGMMFAYENSKELLQYYNLAADGVTQVKDIAEMVVARMENQTGAKADIVYGSSDRGWKGDVPYTWLEAEKLASAGWKASMSSNEAVLSAVDRIVRERHST